MPAASKKATAEGRVMDVSSPGKTAASATSKPIIISNHPIMQDPMVVSADKPDESSAPGAMAPSKKSAVRIKLQPLSEADLAKQAGSAADEDTKDGTAAPAPAAEKPVEEPAPAGEKAFEPEAEPAETEPKPEVPVVTPEAAPAVDAPAEAAPAESDKADKGPQNDDPAAKAAEEAAAHDLEIQKLAESKKYYLPIDTVEKRRNRRAVALGVLMSLVLIAAWVDIALDAGLVHIAGVKAVTHFFS